MIFMGYVSFREGNTEKRKLSKAENEKDLFKLMRNAVCAKTTSFC